MKILAGDIGGTKTELAICSLTLKLYPERYFKSLILGVGELAPKNKVAS